MELIKIFIFEIDYKSLILFFAGLLFGILIFLIIFLILMMSTRKNKTYLVKSREHVTPHNAEELINNAVDKYNQIAVFSSFEQFKTSLDISRELMENIAKLFFPKKKEPLYELTINELINIVETVSIRIDDWLNSSRMTKFAGSKVTLSLLFSLADKKPEASELKKASDKKNWFQSISTTILNKVKKTTLGFVGNVAERKLLPMACEFIIRTSGEECYKAFAKKLNIDENIDSGVEYITEKEENGLE